MEQSITVGLQNVPSIIREQQQSEQLPRVEQFPQGYRAIRFIEVLGDDILALIGFFIFSILILLISFTNLHIQTDRQWVSFIYSIGGDISMHLLVTSITCLVLSIRIKRGIRLDSLCDYLAVLSGPKAQFSLFKWSRFWTMLTLILMNHLAEQAVNYGVPSQPSLNPGRFKRERIIMAPLGGGIYLEGDPTREDGDPKFRHFATGLSILASPPDTDNSEFYIKNDNQLVLYHLPYQLFQSERKTLVTQEFETMGYVGNLTREQPVALSRCAATTSHSLENNCKGPIPKQGSRFMFEVKSTMPPDDSNRTDILYKISLLNTDQDLYGGNWTYSATLRRSMVKTNCQKQDNSISCRGYDTGNPVTGKDWINVTAHEEDILENMATCFVNLISLNTRHRFLDDTELAAKIIAALHVRHAADNTFTGALATSQVKEKLHFYMADAILTFSGPLWLRYLLSTISILGAFSLIGKLIVKPSVPSTLISIISCMGEVVTTHRATCISERKRAVEGLYEKYDRGLKVYGGLAVGTDRSFESGNAIKLVFGAGPGARQTQGAENYSPDLAHFVIQTKDKVVPFSKLTRKEISSLVIGYTRYDDETVPVLNMRDGSKVGRVIGYRRCGEGVMCVYKKRE